MPAGLSKTEEKAWRRAKKTFKKQRGRKPRAGDWPLIMHITKQIAKSATAVEVQPYKKIVMDAVNLVEQLNGSGFFAGITKIVLEPGDPGHFGLSRSDHTDTIYVSSDKISAQAGSNRREEIVQVALTLVHEVAHIRAKFQGGEAPSEQAERDLASKLKAELDRTPDLLDKYAASQCRNELVVLANQLDQLGFESAADIITMHAFAGSGGLAATSRAVVTQIALAVSATPTNTQAQYRSRIAESLSGVCAGGTADFIVSQIVGKV